MFFKLKFCISWSINKLSAKLISIGVLLYQMPLKQYGNTLNMPMSFWLDITILKQRCHISYISSIFPSNGSLHKGWFKVNEPFALRRGVLNGRFFLHALKLAKVTPRHSTRTVTNNAVKMYIWKLEISAYWVSVV